MNELQDQLHLLETKGYSPDVKDVERTLVELPLIERSCLLLSVEGFTPEEIAEILDIEEKRSIEAIQYGREQFLRIYSALVSTHQGNEALVVHDPKFVDILIKSLADAEVSTDSGSFFPLQEKDDRLEQGGASAEDVHIFVQQGYDKEGQKTPLERDLTTVSSESNTSPLGLLWHREDDKSQSTTQKRSPLELGNKSHKQWIGSYCIQGILGAGKTGKVYQALHALRGDFAAIKVLNVRLMDESIAQFYKEASLLSQFEHSHIVRVFDYGIEDDKPYLVMEHAPNGSLRERHPKGARLPLATVVDYIRQIADALQYVHNRGLVHLDIKPENLLLGVDDRLLLSDCGFASVIPRKYIMDSTTHWKLWNSNEYIAPEQFSGELSPASDQYALGAIVYEWLTGMPLIKDKALDKSSVLYPPLKQVAPELPLDVDQVVLRALQREPAHRFASVSDFATALEQASKPKKLLVRSSALASLGNSAKAGLDTLGLSHETQLATLYPVLLPLAKRWVYAAHIYSWYGQENDIAWDIVLATIQRLYEYQLKAQDENIPTGSFHRLSIRIAKNYFQDLRRKDSRLQPFIRDDSSQVENIIHNEINISDAILDKAYEEWLFEEIAKQIASFPPKLRLAMLIDIARRMEFDVQPTLFQSAFLKVGIQLREYENLLPRDPIMRSRHASLVSLGYRKLAMWFRSREFVASRSQIDLHNSSNAEKRQTTSKRNEASSSPSLLFGVS